MNTNLAGPKILGGALHIQALNAPRLEHET